MEGSFHRRAVFIFLFWILVPTFDQYTDIEMVTRLFIRGPSPDMNITSCKDVKSKYCQIILIYSRHILPHTSKISRTTKGSTSKCPNCLQEGHFKRINYIIVYILYHGRLMISLLSWWVFQYSYQPSSQ